MAWIPIPGARKGYYSEDGKGRYKKVAEDFYFRISPLDAQEVLEFFEKGQNIVSYCSASKPTVADPPPPSKQQ